MNLIGLSVLIAGFVIAARIGSGAPSRRERIATAALTGWIARGEAFSRPLDVAGWSVDCADALIAELDKPGSAP